ncbi:hypothetical protein PFX98_19745 [Paucibacter sediminis]|uniref:Uncharacterized protein n=1 Tax=Paucibacter sediminis TaxID=3019553 RepID=A0AA95NF41_9BURK|nr:hypothetical protein [Paucibacter sp. S2-9]WIT11114.1 hypothetical protein PFX98_19745 [Paucibacter sp. S2-9]
MRLNPNATSLVDPFAMLLDLDSVVFAMEHSERLSRLRSRIYRPLDKPLIPKGKAALKALSELADFDRMVDDAGLECDADDTQAC